MKLDVDNFRDFNKEEYLENLKRLGIDSHEALVGEEVYYIKSSYGVHKVISWNRKNGLYLLQIEKSKFWVNPFTIIKIEII